MKALLLLLLLLPACREPGEANPAPDPPAPAGEPAPTRADAPSAEPAAGLPEIPAGETLALAPGAADRWSAREIGHVPKYFLAHGWTDAGTLWGLTGSNTLRVRVDEAEYSVWQRGTWGASPSPTGGLLTWIGERGVWVGGGGREPRLLIERATLEGGEDLTGPPLWSPDSDRLLVTWAGEGGAVFGITGVASGETTFLSTRGEGYLLVEPFAWLDARRVLFSAQPRFSTEWSPAPRRDLAVHDRETGAHRRVTDVPEGTLLHPLTIWGEHGVLVGEGSAGAAGFSRFRIYDTRDWSSRPVALPPGERVSVHDTTRAIVIERLGEREGSPEFVLHLWESATGRAAPLARVWGNDLRVAWSPDGRRLLVGREGRTHLIEPRSATPR